MIGLRRASERYQSLSTPRALSTPRGRGFTVVELIITIGAIAIITVGIAQIFQSVGETVTGGRRVSGFTQAAARMETQLRQDIAQMTRDGFLIIRNEQINNVRLSPGADQTSDRARRVDELAFFAVGDFTSVRPQARPLGGGLAGAEAPQRIARSNQARIYYGHGMQVGDAPSNVFDGNPAHLRPVDTFLGAERGLNEYASDWTLLRHVTLLAKPESPDPDLRLPIRDSEYQFAYQPAATHLFKALAHRGGNDVGQSLPRTLYSPSPIQPNNRPSIASGVVDIAMTNLEEIRSIVLDLGGIATPNLNANTEGHPRAIAARNDLRLLSDPLDTTVLLDGNFLRSGVGALGLNPVGDLPFMHAWMRDSLPAYSSTLQADGNFRFERIRYEPAPIGLISSLRGVQVGVTGGALADPVITNVGHQVALGASALLPRCTEFIVEWSFGKVRPVDSAFGRAGELIWHGMQRLPPDDENWSAVRPYTAGDGVSNPEEASVYRTRFARRDGTIGQHPVTRFLIHDNESFANNNPNELVSYFGYIDPTFNPGANDPVNIPWAWPRLLRVTATFADENDPTVEETFQFVFELPQN